MCSLLGCATQKSLLLREREKERGEKNLLPNPRELIIKPRLNGSDYLSLPEL